MVRGFDGFESSLFINCPFDREYVPLLHSLVFVVFECGLQPRRLHLAHMLEELRFSERDVEALEIVEYIGFIKNWKTSPGSN